MRRVAVLSLAVLLMLLPVARAADPDDPRDSANVTNIIHVRPSPQLAPGESGEFVFNVSNPYGRPMQNIVLNVSIYRYATIEETAPVDASWRWAFPRFRSTTPPCDGHECRVLRGAPSDRLGNGTTDRYIVERLTIATSRDMPHGSIFAQSAYFIRFWLEFTFDNGTVSQLRFASRGYFSESQWREAAETVPGPGCGPYNATNRCQGSINLTRLGVDGVLADDVFGVREPIPIWPFYGLLVLTGFFLVLAFLFWVEENPGRYPRIERPWLTFKGRLRRIVRLPRARKI
jgi:hypothetical protein